MLANITPVENLVRQLKDLEETITEVQTTNKIVSILPYQFQHFRVVWDTYKESE
jgi:predicted metallo-beta-lactamase superfamily hydrolase